MNVTFVSNFFEHAFVGVAIEYVCILAGACEVAVLVGAVSIFAARLLRFRAIVRPC